LQTKHLFELYPNKISDFARDDIAMTAERGGLAAKNAIRNLIADAPRHATRK
jgi:hypothetical protein